MRVTPILVDSLGEAMPGTAQRIVLRLAFDGIVSGLSSMNRPGAYQRVDRPLKGTRLSAWQEFEIKIWLTWPTRIQAHLMIENLSGHAEIDCHVCRRAFYYHPIANPNMDHECGGIG